MRNQDHPAQWTPYSDIRSTTKESRRMTATADVGYQLWRTQNYKVGAFIGVGSINDRVNAYGCHQVATSTACNTSRRFDAEFHLIRLKITYCFLNLLD